MLAVLFVAVLNLPESVSRAVKHSVREALAPLQDALAGFWRSVHEGVESARGLGTIYEENKRLAGEVATLQNTVNDLRSLERVNNDLRKQLDFHARAPRALIACEIISRNPDGWWQTLRLNKGTAEGVQPDLAVISLEGLVGKTVDVSEHTADVLLIADPGCKVSAQIPRSGSFGVLSGRGPSWRGQVVCKLEFINKNVPIQAGDEVITSGLGGIFPKGLRIGYVDRVVMDESGLYQRAEVISKADIGALQYVFVVKTPRVDGLFETGAAAK